MFFSSSINYQTQLWFWILTCMVLSIKLLQLSLMTTCLSSTRFSICLYSSTINWYNCIFWWVFPMNYRLSLSVKQSSPLLRTQSHCTSVLSLTAILKYNYALVSYLFFLPLLWFKFYCFYWSSLHEHFGIFPIFESMHSFPLRFWDFLSYLSSMS